MFIHVLLACFALFSGTIVTVEIDIKGTRQTTESRQALLLSYDDSNTSKEYFQELFKKLYPHHQPEPCSRHDSETKSLAQQMRSSRTAELTRPLLDDRDNKIFNSSINYGSATDELEKSLEQSPNHDLDLELELSAKIKALRTFAAEWTAIEHNKKEAYRNLYQTALEYLLVHYSTCPVPKALARLKRPSVRNPKSYDVRVSSLLGETPQIYLAGKSYWVYVPLPNNELQYLKMQNPQAPQQTYARLAHLLADVTSYNRELRAALKNKLHKIKHGALFASWLTTTALWMHQDTQDDIPGGKIAGHFFGNIFAHLAGGFLLEYPIKIIMTHRQRNDDRTADLRAARETPYMADMNPLITCLARDYVSQNLIRDIETLESRKNWCCWLFCCPAFNFMGRTLKKPLRQASEPERIHALLTISHDRLTQKLLKKHDKAIAVKFSAQRVHAAYNQALSSLSGLNPDNLENISLWKGLHLNSRRRAYLEQTIQRSRARLTACVPHEINTLAS